MARDDEIDRGKTRADAQSRTPNWGRSVFTRPF
jgi:hypothetical protein